MSIKWFLFRRITRALWFLPALFSFFAVVVLGMSSLSSVFFPGPIGPENLPITISQDAIKTILNVLAASMLTVAVFALSTLVNLLANAAQTGSPRAVSLIVEDRRAQTSISIFIGAFLFSIVGIIGLFGEIYSTSGRLILFGATVLVVLAIVFALIRWIGQISVVGRVGETTDRVEKATRHALDRLGPTSLWGCCRASEPVGEFTVRAAQIGFVQHFDRQGLQKIAEENGIAIHVLARPGTYVDFETELARVDGGISEDCAVRLRDSFFVGAERTFEYDPGFGLTVLAEIGRRALSPAVNDPGTAMDVIATQTRVLGEWARASYGEETEAEYDRVSVRPIAPAELVAEAFDSLSRDACGSLDVTLALLRALGTLAKAAPADFRQPAQQLAQKIAARAETSMAFPADIAAIKAAASQVST
ncbi:DUF2254 domain-containing protein [Mesorhizobium sp. WSM2239]|uniref:DUF2254 domain-containing protein n=2 Tax=unclassified Mesorhizobium TaxID=325217 RepID=A0AAU8D2B0_9HYPH